jgi:hypothetical protein
MAFDGFARHGHGVIQILPSRETTRNIRYFHAPGVFVIAHGNRNWVKHVCHSPKALRVVTIPTEIH